MILCDILMFPTTILSLLVTLWNKFKNKALLKHQTYRTIYLAQNWFFTFAGTQKDETFVEDGNFHEPPGNVCNKHSRRSLVKTCCSLFQSALQNIFLRRPEPLTVLPWKVHKRSGQEMVKRRAGDLFCLFLKSFVSWVLDFVKKSKIQIPCQTSTLLVMF